MSAVLLSTSLLVLGPSYRPVLAADERQDPEARSTARPLEAIPVEALPIDLDAGGTGAGGGGITEFLLADGTRIRPDEPGYDAPSTTQEVVSARSEHGRVTANPDGTFTADVSPGRLNYLDRSGEWQPLDLALEKTADGYRVKGHDRDIVFSTTIDGDTLVSIATDKAAVSIRAIGLDSVAEKTEEAIVDRAAGGHEAVSFQAADYGVEFRAILDDAAAARTYRFALDAGGLTVALADDGRSILLTSEGVSPTQGPIKEHLGRISAPVLFDANGVVAPTDAVTVKLAPIAGGETELTYTIADDWLAKARYPVTLDPTLCVQVGTSSGCTQNYGGGYLEAYAGSNQLASGAASPSVLRVGYDDLGAPDAVWNTLRTYLWFETKSMFDFTANTTATITSATISLRQTDNREGAHQNLMARPMKIAWAPGDGWGDIAGEYRPGYDSPAVSTCSTGTTDCTVNLDVSDAVRSWYTRRGKEWKVNYGVEVKLVTELTTTAEVQFYPSTNGTLSNRPKLTITYEVPKVAIDFHADLGANYAPANMVVGVPVKLPLSIKNDSSSFTFDKCTGAGDADCFGIGYRFIRQDGYVAAGGTGFSDLTADITSGSTGTATLAVTPPTTPGSYTLKVDLVHRLGGSSGTKLYAGDWAKPSAYYSRDKKILSSDGTRWTGSASVERTEFGVEVGLGITPVEPRTVGTGEGGSLSVDLATRNLRYEASDALGFADLIGMTLQYRYDSAAAAADCPSGSSVGYIGFVGACGWSTNWDERILDISTEDNNGTYIYQGPSGGRYYLGTTGQGQVTGGPSVRIERPRVTYFDENGAGPNTSVLASAEGFTAKSGTRVLKLSQNDPTMLGSFIPTTLVNTYQQLTVSMRTSSATTAGFAVYVNNLSDPEASPTWLAYKWGAMADPYPHTLPLGSMTSGGWSTATVDLYHDIRNEGIVGSRDLFEITSFQVLDSGANGSVYVDAAFLRPALETVITEPTFPTFSANNGLASSYTATAAGGSATSLKVTPADLAGSPRCDTSTSCWGATTGGLFARPFASWDWYKVGGDTIGIRFDFKDLRDNATGSITYYAGSRPPAGYVNPVQVATEVPEGWAHVTRNILEDARQILGFYDDESDGAPSPDDVRWVGYVLSAGDGNFALFDNLEYGSLPDKGDEYGLTAGSDFKITYTDRSVHSFNRDGLLTKIADRDGNAITLDYTYDPTVTNSQKSYTLTTIHAPTDGSTSGTWTYDRELAIARTTGSGTRTVTVTEKLGTVGTPITGRSTAFLVATASASTSDPATPYAAEDLIKVNPARRDATCAAASTASGCVIFTYTDTTSHKLKRIADPRWDQTTIDAAGEYRFAIDWSSGTPDRIVDKSHNGSAGADLLRILSWDRTLNALGARVLWQDAAARAANFAIHTDLIADGRLHVEYVPQACTGACTTSSGTWPDGTSATLASKMRTANKFDGLARINEMTSYRLPSAKAVVSRQATRAGAKVDNYIDPLTAGQIAWRQTPEQHYASLAGSGGTDPDRYRTTYVYDDQGRVTRTRQVAYNAGADIRDAILTPTTAGATDLYGYYGLDETSGTTATDQDGSAQNGTHTGSVLPNATSYALAEPNWTNKGASYNGTTAVTTLASFGTASGSFTASAYVKPDVDNLTMAIMGSRKGDTATTDYTFDVKLVYDTATKQRSVGVDIGNGTVWLLAGFRAAFDWQKDRWQHIAVSVDDATDTVSVFADGQLIGAGPFTTSGTPWMATATRVMKIGNNGRDSINPEWFDGVIDEVALYKASLNRAQVKAIYDATRAQAVVETWTTYDDEGHPTQTTDQYLGNAGFESGEGHSWRSSASVTHYTAATPGDAGVHSGLGAQRLGTDGAIAQEVVLVPGQTVQFQAWNKVVSSGVARYELSTFDPSTGSWSVIPGFPVTHTDSTWTARAWELTLPTTSDGRLRVRVNNSAGVGNVYLDDLAVLTGVKATTYLANGLPSSTSSASPAGIGLVVTTSSYAATATLPAVVPTTVVVNDVTSPTDLTTQDLTSTSTYDTWGRALSSTDPDGVTTTTSYVTAGEGKQTDIAYTEDELGNRTSMTYDGVGNVLTTTSPRGAISQVSYDLLNHAIDEDLPDGTRTRHVYNAYGQQTSVITNYVDGTASSGIDDIITASTFDEFGRVTTVVADQSGIAQTTTTAFDLLDNVTSTTTHGRTTTYHFASLATGDTSRAAATGTQLPIAPPYGSGPDCPGAASTGCSATTTLDFNGRTIATTDAYRVVTASMLDLGGRPVRVTQNPANGVHASGETDTDIITLTTYGITGLPRRVESVAGLVSTTAYDAVGRSILTTAPDASFTKTRYTKGSRVDLTSRTAASGTADASLVWTKTVYDQAGRAISTLDHYDGTNARLFVDSFERDFTGWSTAASGDLLTSAASGGPFAGETGTTIAAPNGLRLLQVSTSVAGTNSGVWRDYSGRTFQSGRTYHVRFSFYASSGTQFRAFLGRNVASGDRVEFDADPNTGGTQPITGTSSWQTYTFTWTPAASTSSNVQFVIRKDTAGSASVWLDDVVLWDGGAYDYDIPSETVYDADGNAIRSVLPPGDPAVDRPLVTATAYDDRGAVTAVSTNARGGYHHSVWADIGSAVAYWPLDDVATGVAAPTHAGAATLSPTAGVRKGVAGGTDEARTAYRLSGSSRLTASLALPSSAYSIEGWFRTDTPNQTSKGIAGDFNSSSGGALVLNASGAFALLHNAASISSGVTPQVGRWYHLVGTWDGTNLRIYVNDAVTSTTTTGAAGSGASNFEVGAYANGGGMVAGDIDEVAVYNAALSSTRVTAHFGAGRRSDADTALTTRSVTDVLGRATATQDPRGTVTRYVYDRLGRTTETIANYVNGTPSDGATVDDDLKSTYAYAVTGELVGYCPAAQNVVGGCTPSSGSEDQAWRYAYDAMGRMVTQTPPVATTVTALDVSRWVYETGGRLQEECQTTTAATSCTTTGANRRTAYTYDDLGRPLTTTLYSGASAGSSRGGWTTAYNANGDGQVATIAYTGTSMYNETAGVTVNQGTDTLTYAYVTSGNGIGQLDTITRGATVLTDYAYNGDGTVSSRVDREPYTPYTAHTTSFSYDWAKRNVNASSATLIETNATFGYRLDGLLATRGLPNSETFALAYDAAKRPLTLTMANGNTVGRTYDRDGNVVTDTRSFSGVAGDAGGTTVTYGYDDMDRLISETGLATSRSYEYDHDGNRTKRVDGAVTTTFAYDRTDQLISLTSGSTRSFAYDRFGNQTTEALTGADQRTMAYDTGLRLISLVTAGAVTATFTPDALGRQLKRTASGVTEWYGYLGTSETVWAVHDQGAGGWRSGFDLGGATRIATTVGAATDPTYLVPDLLGSLVATETLASTAIAHAWRYDGYGQLLAKTATAPDLDIGFFGALDRSPDGTPLYDIGARYYSPSSGVWSQLDTVMGNAQDPRTMNRFLYAHSNPATLIDPSGHAARSMTDGGSSGTTVAEKEADPEAFASTYIAPEDYISASSGSGASAPAPPEPPLQTTTMVKVDKYWTDPPLPEGYMDALMAQDVDLSPRAGGPCVSGSVAVGIVAAAQACVVQDFDKFESTAIVLTFSPLTQASTGIGANVTGGAMVSNVSDLSDLNGPMGTFGGSAGAGGIAASGDLAVGRDPHGNQVYAADVGVGRGFALDPWLGPIPVMPVEGHSGGSGSIVIPLDTHVLPLPVNPWTIIRGIHDVFEFFQ
jgi:RHS repeat-associated protein